MGFWNAFYTDRIDFCYSNLIVLETTLGSQNSLSDFKNQKNHKIFRFLEVRALFSGSSNRKNPGNFRFLDVRALFSDSSNRKNFHIFPVISGEKNTDVMCYCCSKFRFGAIIMKVAEVARLGIS